MCSKEIKIEGFENILIWSNSSFTINIILAVSQECKTNLLHLNQSEQQNASSSVLENADKGNNY